MPDEDRPSNSPDPQVDAGDEDWASQIDASPERVLAARFPVGNARFEDRRRHSHRRSQLIHTERGLLLCEVDRGIWIVPPGSAVWIPGGLPHMIAGSGDAECTSLFMEPDEDEALPGHCTTLTVTQLLRAVMAGILAGFPKDGRPGRSDRLVGVLIDEIAEAERGTVHLPMPADDRLRRLTEEMLADPGTRIAKGDWARRLGMGERSLTRLFDAELGMTMGRWRQQLHVVMAMRLLTSDIGLQKVTTALGYDTVANFSTMFRKIVGVPPRRYVVMLDQRPDAAVAERRSMSVEAALRSGGC